jgi:leader peptidase (prepilin peptidase)/N-methyltransferase
MDWMTALVMAAWGFISGLVVPDVIRALPEPEPDRPLTDEEKGGSSDDEGGTPAEEQPEEAEEFQEPKELYVDIAAIRGLRFGSAIAGALIAGLIGARLGGGWGTITWAYLTPVAIALAIVDWRTKLLPTRIIAPSYVVVLVLFTVATLIQGDATDLIRAGYGWAIAGGTFLVLWIVNPGGLGYGDVRLSGLLGLATGYLGWGELLTSTFAGFLLGGLGGAVLVILRLIDRRSNPFGPWMLIGALIGVLFGADVAAWYTS